MQTSLISILGIIGIWILSFFMGKSTNEFMSVDYPTYDAQWAKVEEQDSLGKPKSAMELVETIYQQAKREKNAPQIYKSLMYQSRYTMVLEEDSELTIVNRFKDEIQQAEAPTKQLLQSGLAELYWSYYNANRWKFRDRSATDDGIDEADFRTWDLTRLFNETRNLYLASLADEEATKVAPIADFEAILLNYNDRSQTYNYLRPTLYDYLVHRAIQFFRDDQSGLTQPAYQFTISDKKAFAPIQSFLNYQPTTKDSTSNQLTVLKLYQELLAYHKSTKNEDALIFTNVERLNYVHSNATLQDKDKEYEAALLAMLKKYKKNETVAIAGAELAELYRTQGNSFKINVAEEHQWKLKEAIEFCDKIIAEYPNSIGAKNCLAIKTQILTPQLNAKVVAFEPVNSPIRMLIHYKNIDELFFSIIPIQTKEVDKFNRLNKEDKRKYLLKNKPIQTHSSKTPSLGDYQIYSYEEIITETGLPNGSYIVTATPDSALSKSSEVFGAEIIQVTDIAYSNIRRNGYDDFYVKHRVTGEPIKNAKVTFKTDKNNREIHNKTFQTDENGYVKVKKYDRVYYSTDVSIEAIGQTAYYRNYYLYGRVIEDVDTWDEFDLTFTDRSIYRPGQTLYFKSVLFLSKKDESRLRTNQKVNVRLYDANNEEIEHLTLRTNEYGSIQGSFTLPKGRMLGQYRIEVDYGNSHYFRVEEYKRPKFEVELDTLAGNYKLGDNIQAEGKATAYAGSSINNAQVRYRVTRKVHFPYWRYSWYRPMPRGESMEVAFGETTTDEQGRFDIPFTAIPDQSIDNKDNPIYSYDIQVDVTDVNGETRSSRRTVRVGAVALDLQLSLPQPFLKENKQELTIHTKNLNGKSVAAKGKVEVFKLQQPKIVKGNRLLPVPDQQQISKEDWMRLFPHEPYDSKEEDVKNWEIGKQVLSTTFSTSEESGSETIRLNAKRWEQGWYRVVVNSKDAFGKEVTQQKQIFLIDEYATTVADNELFTFHLNQDSYQPGDIAELTVGSAAEDVVVSIEVFLDESSILKKSVVLNNELTTIEVPIKEAHRGGLFVEYHFVKWNSIYSGSQQIKVPWSNKHLQIDVATFRDKLQPGDEETWRFTVKGSKGEQVSAEVLASMYDSSLDQFTPHNWDTSVGWRQQYNPRFRVESNAFGVKHIRNYWIDNKNNPQYTYPRFAEFNFFGMNLGYVNRYYRTSQYLAEPESVQKKTLDSAVAGVEVAQTADAFVVRGSNSIPDNNNQLIILDGEVYNGDLSSVNMDNITNMTVLKGADATALYGSKASNGAIVITTKDGGGTPKPLQVKTRKKLNETAFFFPQLSTDKNGQVTFSFTTPESLTKWRVMMVAHTKSLETGYWEGNTITQKELMVMPNPPRFFREGDEISFTTKIANLSKKELNGQAELQLLDATTMQPVYNMFSVNTAVQPFNVSANGNTSVTWTLKIPENVPAVTYRVVAKADNFSDGEESTLPILSNRMLVTESLPITLRSNETKTFTLDKLKNNASSTLTHHKLTLEMSSNPAWYAVQSLPYLMDYQYECSEQIFSRYYANSLASHVANSHPKIKSVFDVWRNYQPDELLSNLEKNEELKSLLLRETPWVREAKSEAEQKRRIAVLFDLNRMANEQDTAIQQLIQQQKNSGGWSWFPGGKENEFITRHILAGLGHLTQLGVKDVREDKEIWNMTKRAIFYLDNELRKEYEDLKRNNKHWNKIETVGYGKAHYFYARSFFKDVKVSKQNEEAFNFYFEKMKEDVFSESLYINGLTALSFHRYGEDALAQQLVTSLRETSIVSEELGMYWKDNKPSWWWYRAPIETHALMIEVFDEIANDQQAVDELKVWLLANKRTTNWGTTKATAEAVYALLLRGGDWLAVDELVDINIAGEELDITALEDVDIEAGTGYFKTSWNTTEIQPEMGEVTVAKKGEGVAWGGLYWQYFEELDKLTTHKTPLQLNKQLFLQKNTATGPKIEPIIKGDELAVGDLLQVRIELRVDRDMEFVHMKDMRAAGFEPTNVISQYKWQDGLGYYESTKDASTDFFFDYLPKGIYVFEYPLRVNNEGDFSNGITTIQSMYAPEFTSHSEGVRVKVLD